MMTLKEHKKYMKEAFKFMDPEKGETFEEWWKAYLDALKEEGSLIIIDKTTYVKD